MHRKVEHRSGPVGPVQVAAGYAGRGTAPVTPGPATSSRTLPISSTSFTRPSGPAMTCTFASPSSPSPPCLLRVIGVFGDPPAERVAIVRALPLRHRVRDTASGRPCPSTPAPATCRSCQGCARPGDCGCERGRGDGKRLAETEIHRRREIRRFRRRRLPAGGQAAAAVPRGRRWRLAAAVRRRSAGRFRCRRRRWGRKLDRTGLTARVVLARGAGVGGGGVAAHWRWRRRRRRRRRGGGWLGVRLPAATAASASGTVRRGRFRCRRRRRRRPAGPDSAPSGPCRPLSNSIVTGEGGGSSSSVLPAEWSPAAARRSRRGSAAKSAPRGEAATAGGAAAGRQRVHPPRAPFSRMPRSLSVPQQEHALLPEQVGHRGRPPPRRAPAASSAASHCSTT